MTQTAKKSPFSMNVDLMHGPIFKNLLLFMLPIFCLLYTSDAADDV